MGKYKKKEENETLNEKYNIMEICSILSNVKCNKAMFPVGAKNTQKKTCISSMINGSNNKAKALH